MSDTKKSDADEDHPELQVEKTEEEETAASASAATAVVVVAAADVAADADALPKSNDTKVAAPAPKPLKPSYYVESFHEHFFPHPDDLAALGVGDPSSLPPRKPLSVPQRYAASMARRPWTHLLSALVVAVVLSFVGLGFGEFTVAINNEGWWSRGTLIADRATQEQFVDQNAEELFLDETGEFWEEAQTKVYPNWEGSRNDRPSENEAEEGGDEALVAAVCSGEWYGSGDMVESREQNLVSAWKTSDAEDGDPQDSALDADALYDMCRAEENTLRALEDQGLCYECPNAGRCAEPYSLVLLARLHLAGDDVFDASSPAAVTCDDLRSRWTESVKRKFAMALKVCANWTARMVTSGGKNTISLQDATITVQNPCPFPVKFHPVLVDSLFPSSDDSLVRYTSSYYATKKGKEDVAALFEVSQDDALDRGDGTPLSAVYETTDEDFIGLYSDSILGRDMSLAIGSAGVTLLAMTLHTKSPFLTFVGLLQIILSFPIAYFVYYFIGGLVYFPFLNFIGIFVVFALGADDVFVAVDKWKNARSELPRGTTEQVAALALPDAAYSMLLTSSTTAVAFFATAICPVGPIVCFAVFVGLLITFDYMMNIFLVFPALCIYDRRMQAGSANCCVGFDWCCGRKDGGDQGWMEEPQRNADGTWTGSTVGRGGDAEGGAMTLPGDGEEKRRTGDALDAEEGERRELLEAEHQTLIYRLLNGYYNILHKFRWICLGIVVVGIITSTVFASQLSVPETSVVSFLPDSNQYQMHSKWTQNLLAAELKKAESGDALILWGVKPADTGDHINPDSWTSLVLDDDFDPKSEDSQTYLLDFCGRVSETFGNVDDDYKCPMVLFDEWLEEQSTTETPTEAYAQKCNGASSVPVPSDVFDPCIISWSKLYNNTSVLQTDNSVKIMRMRTKSNVNDESPHNKLKDEWNAYEAWMDLERKSAPVGVNQMFQSDIVYWWLDTNQQMMKTAYGAAGIALACATVIIFASAKSFVLTFFAAIAIVYVLVAATACLVGMGWSLGFLESVLFAILIGISCDFVIHIAHAYTMYGGDVSRHHRSQFSLTHMGPSILAAAFTTFMAAVVMVSRHLDVYLGNSSLAQLCKLIKTPPAVNTQIFTEITFFRKFAVILFMTILHSTIGCFVVFLVLCDCFGPAEPTKTFYAIKTKIGGRARHVVPK